MTIAIIVGPWRAVMAQENPSPRPTIAIPEPLLVTMQAVPGYGPAPLLVGFLVNVVDPSGAEVVAYKWNFGDGHSATTNPTLTYNTYANAGNYVATVTVTTTDGRSATGFAGIIVKPAAGTTMQGQ
jgi:uncharacterized membrane protein